MNTYTLKEHHVNSKLLFNEVTDFINNIIIEFSIIWDSDVHRDAILEVIDEFFMEMCADEKITQFNVICDARNNTVKSAAKGFTHLEVRYKQDDCYNTTSIDYVILNDNSKTARR